MTATLPRAARSPAPDAETVATGVESAASTADAVAPDAVDAIAADAVTAVICTYTEQRWPLLTAAVTSLLDQTHPPHEVLVVVDHNPAMADRCRAELCGVRVLENVEARGLSGGRNTALRAAAAPLVAFLDDDAVAEPDWLAHLVRHFTDPDVAGVGGRVTPAWSESRPPWFPPEFDWVLGCTYTGVPHSLAQVRNPFGGAMVLRAASLDGLGAYRTDLGRRGTLPLGCEETELCLRITRHRRSTVFLYEPSAEIHHHVPAERATWAYFRRRCYAEGLSKAAVRRLDGDGAALATERSYVRHTLPVGFARAITSTLTGDLAAVGRAAAMILGLGATVAGFVTGTITASCRWRRRPTDRTEDQRSPDVPPDPHSPAPVPDHHRPPPDRSRLDRSTAAAGPTWVTAVHIDAEPADLMAPPTPAGERYPQAEVVVLLHQQPVGTLTVDLTDGWASGPAVHERVAADLGVEITRHLVDDGLDPDAPLRPERPSVPPCWTETNRSNLPSISVLLCTRDRPDQAVAAIETLLELDYPDFEVVVVDNAPSSLATADAVHHRFGSDPRVRYVREDEPGLAAARNRGIVVARSALVAFTDDDIRVSPWWLRALVRGFGRAPHVVCVTGAVATASRDTPAEAHFARAVAAEAKWGYEPRLFDLGEHRGPSPLFPYQAGTYGGGGNVAFDRRHLLAVGGLDRALGAGTPTAGGEDLDAFLTTLTAGGAIAFEPAALVWHHHGTDDRAARRQAFSYGVGLGAFLTKTATASAHRRQVAIRAPRALHYLLSARSDKNVHKGPDHPASLTLLELAGVAWGPVAYLRSRREHGPAPAGPRSLDPAPDADRGGPGTPDPGHRTRRAAPAGRPAEGGQYGGLS